MIDWLRSKDFNKTVCDKFTEQDIAGDALFQLDAKILKSEIGIIAYGTRIRIENAIADLRHAGGILSSSAEQRFRPKGGPVLVRRDTDPGMRSIRNARNARNRARRRSDSSRSIRSNAFVSQGERLSAASNEGNLSNAAVSNGERSSTTTSNGGNWSSATSDGAPGNRSDAFVSKGRRSNATQNQLAVRVQLRIG